MGKLLSSHCCQRLCTAADKRLVNLKEGFLCTVCTLGKMRSTLGCWGYLDLRGKGVTWEQGRLHNQQLYDLM